MASERPTGAGGVGPDRPQEPASTGDRIRETVKDMGQRVADTVRGAVSPREPTPGQTVRDVMTANPITLPASATFTDAARVMRDADVGPVVVLHEDGSLCGVVTDRDLVIRGAADGLDPTVTRLEAVCSREVLTVRPDDDVVQAMQLMRDRAIRRLPVVEAGRVVGIVSLGDIAVRQDPESVLGAISAAPAQR